MKGDFSRDTFSPRKHYSAVLMQQGRVQLDADWNEQQAINQHRIETEARNLIGLSGGPADNAGFEISVQDNTLRIGSGDYYVDGILCQNEDTILFGGQDDLPGMDVTDILSPSGEENGVGLVYLDVWERHLTAVEDDRIREVALGGPDTTTRKRTVCQVKARRLDEADTTSNNSELQSLVREHRELANKLAAAHWRFDEDGGATAYDSSENGNSGTLVGPTRSTGKAEAGALLFDGVDDYVQVGPVPELVMTDSVSISAWVHPRGPGSSATEGGIIVNKEGEYEVARFGDGTIRWAFAPESGSSWTWTNTNHVVPLDQWTHIAVVHDAKSVNTYANGKLVDSRSAPGPIGDVDPNANDFRIGGRQHAHQFFQGLIDEVRIFDRPLDDSEVAALAAPTGELHELRTQLQRVKDRILELVKVDPHHSFDDELEAAHPPSTGTLLADTNGSPSTNGSPNIRAPHLLPPGAGYELLENQLYRVEIHKGGGPGVATFKWSRDNGSVVTPVLRIPYAETDTSTGTEIAVRDLGNDETLGFAPGQYVELVSDDRELNEQAGQILRIVGVSPAKRTITVGEKLTPVNPDDARAFHYKLRRWDYPPDQEMPPDGIKIPPNGEPVDLEGGIRVRFSAGHYNVGDYWLIPARTATGDIEWPGNEFRPPAGVEHHYSPLALAMLATVATEDRDSEKHLLVLSDCRDLFPPLTGMTGLFYLGGDGQSALPLRELPEPLVVGVAAGGRPVQGARVKFEVQGEDLASYDGHLAVDSAAATEDGAVKSLMATTDARGEAKCFWTLAKDIPNQQVKVSLADGSHLPIYFNATLSTSQTVSESIQVDKVALGEQELQLNGEIPATALADSEIRVVCSDDIGQAIIKRQPPCNLTLEIPFPLSASDKQQWGDASIGFQPLVLAADVSVQGDVISWKPKKETSAWLKNTLFVKVPSTQILAYFTIKGDFTFPSAGFGRSDDFEMWFRVVKDPVRLNSVTLDRDGVTGQTSSVTGTVNLVGPATAGGVTINLASSNANVARVEPATVTIAAGQTSQTFQVNTTAVATDTPVTITATLEQQQRSANLMVQAPVLESFTVNPNSLFGRATAQGTVTLTGPAPTGGVSVTLQSGNPAVVRVPQTVNVAAGSRTNATPFTIETEPVHTATPVTITASFKGGLRQAILSVQPPVLSALSLQPSSVNGGSPVSGSVTINAAAPAGFAVTLRSTDTTAATVPDSVTFTQNATTQPFTVTTRPVSSRRDLSIVAARSGVERSSALAVQPPRLATFAFSPTRIPNAGRSTGTITLNAPAPSNTVVNLVPSNDATATIPSSVPVAAGATQITFDAIGKTFTDQARSVTVQAIYLGTQLSATLAVDAGKAKEKEKEKEKELKEKDFKEFEKLRDEKEFEKLRAEKEFEKLREDIRIQPFAERPRAEETESAPEEGGSERSFIQPEERPEPGEQTTDGSEEE